MKKNIMMTAALLTSMAVYAAGGTQEIGGGVDSTLFFKPYMEAKLKELSTQVVLDAGHKAGSVSTQLCAYAQKMKGGEKLLVAAPASFGTLFTDGSQPDEVVLQHIQQVLTQIGTLQEAPVIIQHLSELSEVMRATFVQTESGLQLVTDEKSLNVGQKIWCKIPNGVIESAYHSELEYLMAIKQAGLMCEEIKRPCFFGSVKHTLWTAANPTSPQLNSAYDTNHPFTLYYIVKE